MGIFEPGNGRARRNVLEMNDAGVQFQSHESDLRNEGNVTRMESDVPADAVEQLAAFDIMEAEL